MSTNSLKVSDWLAQATSRLDSEQIESAHLDSLILLEDCLAKDRAWLLAHPEAVLSKVQLSTLNNQLNERAKRIPLAYIRGFSQFYGRDFKVSPSVLIPRVESESFINLLKTIPLKPSAKLVDLGCGSGCLGITASLEIPNVNSLLVDISDSALELAKQNTKIYQCPARFCKADLLEDANSAFDILFANLPYVPRDYPVSPEVAHEPELAVYGGEDGLDLYRRLWEQLGQLSDKPSFVLVESLPTQKSVLEKLATAAGYVPKASENLVSLFVSN